MFPISHAAPAPALASFVPATSAQPPLADATDPRHEVAALRDEVVAALCNGSLVDRHVLFPLLTRMQAWPRDLPIDLLSEGAVSGQRFGPRLGYTDLDGPVYVKLCATDRYAIACSLETPPDQWWDCGAVTEPDSLFRAVLAGMQLRDASRHAQFTFALRQSHAGYRTDAQCLRDQLAGELMAAHPPLMRALEDVVGSRGTGGIGAIPSHQGTHAASGAADPTLLQRVASMAPDELLDAAGLCGLWDHDSVFYASLRASARVRSAASVRASGMPGAKRKIDRPLLLDILKEYWATNPREFKALARDYDVDLDRLHEFVLTGFVPTARGLHLIRSKARYAFPPLTREVLEVVNGMHAQHRLPSLNHFVAVAHLCNVSYTALYQHIRAGGLTQSGWRLLGGTAGVHVDTLADKLPVKAGQRVRKALDPDVTLQPLTAPLLLEVIKAFRRPGARNFAQWACDLALPVGHLEAHLYTNGVPKALGVDLLYRAQRKGRFERIDPSVVSAVSALWKDKWIPTPYHLLVVAYAFKVSFEKLQRHVSAKNGLTAQGSEYVLGLRDDGQAGDVRIPWHRLPDRSNTLRLPIDADMSVEVHVVGSGWTASVVETGARPIVSAPMAALPATDAAAPPRSPDPADVLANLPGSPDTTGLSAEDLDLIDGSVQAQDDLLDIRLDDWDEPPAVAAWADPALPDDLMALRAVDLVSPMPGLFPGSPKRPRWDASRMSDGDTILPDSAAASSSRAQGNATP